MPLPPVCHCLHTTQGLLVTAAILLQSGLRGGREVMNTEIMITSDDHRYE